MTTIYSHYCHGKVSANSSKVNVVFVIFAFLSKSLTNLSNSFTLLSHCFHIAFTSIYDEDFKRLISVKLCSL
jgi:hypothetical protein